MLFTSAEFLCPLGVGLMPLYFSICHFSVSCWVVGTVLKFPVMNRSSVFVSITLVLGRRGQSALYARLQLYLHIPVFLTWTLSGGVAVLVSRIKWHLNPVPEGSVGFFRILVSLQSERLGRAALLRGAGSSGEKCLFRVGKTGLFQSWIPGRLSLFCSLASINPPPPALQP